MKPKFTDGQRFKHARYDDSSDTDIRRRFARIEKARKEASKKAETETNVKPMRKTA